jgi:hypothetical protein
MTTKEVLRVLENGVYSEKFRDLLIENTDIALKLYDLDLFEKTAFEIAASRARRLKKASKEELFAVLAQKIIQLQELE